MYRVTSKEGKEFLMSPGAFAQSAVLSMAVGQLYGESLHDQTVPAQHVPTRAMTTIVKWCEHHKDEERLQKHEYKTCVNWSTPEWDRKLLGALDSDSLAELINAASYLEIVRLLSFATKEFADRMEQLSIRGAVSSFGPEAMEKYERDEENRRRIFEASANATESSA